MSEVNIKEINLTYKLTDQIELKNKIRNIQFKKINKDNNGYYEEGILCFKKRKEH